MYEEKIVVAASHNKHKLVEIEAITKQFGMEVISRDEAGVPNIEVVEDGDAFEENSFIKANEIMKLCGQITIADDSGLMVEALNGEPGVYSARYAGVDGDDWANNQKLKLLMKDIPQEKRRAKFVSVITLLYPDGRKIVARGECPGYIIFEERGNGGFGYDPLFVPEGYDKTFGELPSEVKNKISHRAKALDELGRQLQNL